MIGIYKITNLLNNKSYIGQSNNIERRFGEHKTKGATSRIPLDVAIQKYGSQNFSFEILEECNVDKLNEREQYYIQFFDTKNKGYNCTDGGDQQSIGENNGRAKLTEEDVKIIRNAYKNHKRCKEVYKQFEHLISYNNFEGVWQGRTWRHIMPEVFTEENKKFYSCKATNGELSSFAVFTNDEVLKLRTYYINHTAKEVYELVKDKCKYQTLQQMLWGRSYKEVPVYDKKHKVWIELK